VADIFAAEGEAAFRRRESAAIEQVLASPPAVIAVGGGAITDPANVERLRAAALIVWLYAPVEVLWGRIAADPASTAGRPALTEREGPAELTLLLKQRGPIYQGAADLALSTEGAQPRKIARRIRDWLAGEAGW
jgi:shikimate kinase